MGYLIDLPIHMTRHKDFTETYQEEPSFSGNSYPFNRSPLDLPEGDVHVWKARLNFGEAALRHMNNLLSEDEKKRASRFVFQPDRDRFIASRGVLRELLGKYLQMPPAEIAFHYGPRGKPFLPESLENRTVHFNVSHSHDLGLFAFSSRKRVGVDIEFIRHDFGGEEIAERYFSTQELEELRALPMTLREEGFFRCWTRKEAYIKALGDGLLIPLKSFRVSLTPGRPARLESADSSFWTLRSINPDPGYVAALVGEGRGWKLRCMDWIQQT
jgi:4'-phosphopantetheinyl transferase